MDIETFANHIAGLGKDYFDNAGKIVLRDVFNLNAINVDGQGDGGTDFITFSNSGEQHKVGYQITTQKSDIRRKAFRDAQKAIEKLGIQKYYFLTSYNLTETERIKLENEISNELCIQSHCFTPRHIAGLILESGLLNKFLDESNYPLPRDFTSSFDYREMALHSYTILSEDATQMKSSIYDDTVMLVLSTNERLHEDDIVRKAQDFLSLSDSKIEYLKRRIGALFGKNKLHRNNDGTVELHQDARNEIDARKEVYEIELNNLSSAQIDLMINEFNCKWSVEDSKKVSIWIANATISNQIKNLKEAKATLIAHPLFNSENNSIPKLKDFLHKVKNFQLQDADLAIEKLLDIASNHPLITKIARASMYLALEGANPINSAKALGGSRWSDFNILIEPSIAIPCICAQLYSGTVNRNFDLSIRAVRQASKLDSRLFIPYFYLNECAGHLLRARKYVGLDLNEDELVYSPNAFVANYFALKNLGVRVPSSLMDYLASYSTNIKTERHDIKDWVRAIQTDIQSILEHAGIKFIETPFYDTSDCKEIETEYMHHLSDLGIEKSTHLANHDIWGLQFTNDMMKNGEHWIILTYDNSMISMSKSDIYKGWITNPIKFLDFTESTKPLSESKLINLVHSFATFSEKTLSAGARIMDRVINYASPAMQNWEFKQEIETFKKDILSQINYDNKDFIHQIDRKTDEFLLNHGIERKEEGEQGED